MHTHTHSYTLTHTKGIDQNRNIFANAISSAASTEKYLLEGSFLFEKGIIWDTTHSMYACMGGRGGISGFGKEDDGWLNDFGQVIIVMTHFMANGCILYFPKYFTVKFEIEKYVMNNPIIKDVLELVPEVTTIPFDRALAHDDHADSVAETGNATAYRRKDRVAPPLPPSVKAR
jgi:hypothetical protein